MININSEYKIKEDFNFFMEAERINKSELSEATKISRVTLDAIEKRGTASDEVLEKLFIQNVLYQLLAAFTVYVKDIDYVVEGFNACTVFCCNDRSRCLHKKDSYQC